MIEAVEAKKISHRAAEAKYRETKKGRQVHRKTNTKYSKSGKGRAYEARRCIRDREKIRCRKILQYAIRTGKMVRGSCVDCDSIENVEGHHQDYRQPLVVIWLCGGCHRLRHN